MPRIVHRKPPPCHSICEQRDVCGGSRSRAHALTGDPCTTTQGRTLEEALANLKEATELFLEEFRAAI
jgi:MoaA/NifB/PqqE/SkfB family radical SAM enzyme